MAKRKVITPNLNKDLPAGSDASRDQGFLQRIIVDIAKEQQATDDVSLGAMLHQSRERLADWIDADINLLDALLADRPDDSGIWKPLSLWENSNPIW